MLDYYMLINEIPKNRMLRYALILLYDIILFIPFLIWAGFMKYLN